MNEEKTLGCLVSVCLFIVILFIIGAYWVVVIVLALIVFIATAIYEKCKNRKKKK